MNAIEITNLCKSYGDFTLDHLNLTLPGGCIMGLVGENGAGKSTTIRLMMQMIQKDEGTITLLSRNIDDMDALTKEDIGVVMDEVGFPLCLKTKEIGKIMQMTFHNWDQKRYEQLIRQFNIPDNRQFKDFSRGMKMKAGIAVALSHHAKLLILDEATSGLDPVVRDEVLDILNEFTRDENHSILISSHIVSDLEKICDYIAFLHKGKLLLCEEKDRLKEEYGVLHCTTQEADAIPADAVIGRKVSAYGCELLVKRDRVPGNPSFSPVDIEQLFIIMAKEEN